MRDDLSREARIPETRVLLGPRPRTGAFFYGECYCGCSCPRPTAVQRSTAAEQVMEAFLAAYDRAYKAKEGTDETVYFCVGASAGNLPDAAARPIWRTFRQSISWVRPAARLAMARNTFLI